MLIKNTNAQITSEDVYIETDLIRLKDWGTQDEADILRLQQRIPIKEKKGEDATVLNTVLEMQRILMRQINKRMDEVRYGECPELYCFKRAAMEVLPPATMSEIEYKAKKYLYSE